MATIGATAFDKAVKEGWNTIDMEIDLPGVTTVNATTKSYTANHNLTQSGSTVVEGPTPSWEADADDTVTEVDVSISTGAGFSSLINYTTGDGPLDQSVGNGATITLTDYGIDMQQAGMAEILRDGNNSVGVEVAILDSNDNDIDTVTDAASWNWTVSSSLMEADADVEFSNDGSWSTNDIAAVEVRISNSGNRILKESISASVSQGGSITFTTLEVSLTLP